MLYRLWSILAIAICILNFFNSISIVTAVATVIVCRDQPVKLNYSVPLPAASNGYTTTHVEYNGNLTGCEVAGLPIINARYYLSMTLSQANCKEATFTELKFAGNINEGLGILPKLFNLTVDFSNGEPSRQLREPQTFTAQGYFENTIPIPASGDFTFTFPPSNHQPGCQQVSFEQISLYAELNIP